MPGLFSKFGWHDGKAAFVVLAALLLSLPVFAQDQGPLPAASSQDDDVYNPAKVPPSPPRTVAVPPSSAASS